MYHGREECCEDPPLYLPLNVSYSHFTHQCKETNSSFSLLRPATLMLDCGWPGLVQNIHRQVSPSPPLPL